MVSTAGSAFLGLTVGCARCHNHKFDPIAQRDYYAMAAVFAGVQHGERALPARTRRTARRGWNNGARSLPIWTAPIAAAEPPANKGEAGRRVPVNALVRTSSGSRR